MIRLDRYICFLVTVVCFTHLNSATGNEWVRSLDHSSNFGYAFGIASSKRSRGGATQKQEGQEVFTMLARAVQHRIPSKDETAPASSLPEIQDLVRALVRLSEAQKTFKGLDGAAHEAYQRTRSKSESIKVQVSGRASRTAARTSAVALALGACELCELVSNPEVCFAEVESNITTTSSSDDHTLTNREVLFNDTIALGSKDSLSSVRVLVLYEPTYRGGAGVNYGDIQEMVNGTHPIRSRIEGRLFIVVDSGSDLLEKVIRVLSDKPSHVRLTQGSVSDEAASVQPWLHKAASSMLERIDPILRTYNQSAIHIVGHSLGGGVACVAATILDGRLPLKGLSRKEKKKMKKQQKSSDTDLATASDTQNKTKLPPLQGLGRGKTSAVAIGAPPSISSNVQADFIVSLLHGDDFVGRTTSESLNRFLKRTQKALRKGFFGGQFNRMSDTLALATSNLKNYAHGSEGEEARLSVPGRAYLIRPRRLGGVCSIHEIGSQLKGGREAIRASVLWQLDDILLSKSLWKHHQLESYIQGLDRVHIRGLESGSDEGESP